MVRSARRRRLGRRPALLALATLAVVALAGVLGGPSPDAPRAPGAPVEAVAAAADDPDDASDASTLALHGEWLLLKAENAWLDAGETARRDRNDRRLRVILRELNERG